MTLYTILNWHLSCYALVLDGTSTSLNTVYIGEFGCVCFCPHQYGEFTLNSKSILGLAALCFWWL